MNLTIYFLDAEKQSYLKWSVFSRVPQGSTLGRLFFLIFINDLSDNLVPNRKLFADNTSLFSVVQDITLSVKNLNHDLNIDKQMGISVKNEF